MDSIAEDRPRVDSTDKRLFAHDIMRVVGAQVSSLERGIRAAQDKVSLERPGEDTVVGNKLLFLCQQDGNVAIAGCYYLDVCAS